MSHKKVESQPLTRCQKKVLQAIADGRTIDEIRQQIGVKPGILTRWLQSARFASELSRRVEAARRISSVLLIRTLPTVTARLNELAKGENDEIARKACVDVLKLQIMLDKCRKSDPKNQNTPELDPAMAGRLLKALAEEDNITVVAPHQ